MKNRELEGKDIEKIYQLTAENYKWNKGDILLYENTFLLGNLMMRFSDASFVARSSKGLTKKIKNNRFVFVPACKEDIHWTLFAYDREKKTLHYYNSLNGVNNLQYFRPLLKNIFEGKIIEHQTPQQDNGIDCGLYVIAITELLVRRYQNNSSIMNWEINDKEAQEIKKNVPLFRKMLEEDKDYFADLSTETTSKRDAELEQIRDIITSAQKIFDKGKATKEELEQAINHLKTLSAADNDSREAQVWAENKTGNEKLLIGLTEKLNNIDSSPNSNNTIPQTETNPKEEKRKPVDNAVKPDSGKNNPPSPPKSTPTNPPPTQPLEDKVQQDIQQEQREIKNILKNDINQAKHGTDEDKFNAIKNSGKVLGKRGFEEEKSEIATIEEELAINNPSKYLEAVLAKIEENLKESKLTIGELDNEIQADYRNIKDKKEGNVDKLIENIGKEGAKKRIKKFKEKISRVAEVGKEKFQKLKEKLLKFIHSSNKYEQEYKKEAQNLLAQLEKVNQVQKPNSDFPISWVIGGGALVIVGLTVFLVIRNKRKKKL